MPTSYNHLTIPIQKKQRRRTSTSASSPSFQKWTAFRRCPSQQSFALRHNSTKSLPDLGSSSNTSSSDSTIWSDTSVDSDSVSTPTTDISTQSTEDVIQLLEDQDVAEVDLTKTKNKHASTKLVTQDPKDLTDAALNDQNGAQLIQKYCCGGGCCFLQNPIPVSAAAGFEPIEEPDNTAYRKLHLRLGSLTEETQLTGSTPYPDSTHTFSKPAAAPNQASTVATHPPLFVQPHPPYSVFSAPIFGVRELTKPGAQKRTFHFDLDVTDYPEEGGTDFLVGGAIGVCPPNPPSAVEEIFDLLGIPRYLRDKHVVLNTQGGRWPTIWGDETARALTTTRRELLTWCSDIQSYPPTKALLRVLSEHATASNEKKILQFLVSAEGQPSFCELRTGAHVNLIQLLRAFPSSKPPFEDLISVLHQLMPRFYSLSNDPHVSSEREGLSKRRLIELAVTVDESPDWQDGPPRTGVGSGYLERMAHAFLLAEQANKIDPVNSPMPDLRVPMFRGLMANPLSKEYGVSNGPMMLIGAGVGVAPFRGFILNRLKNANCANKIWLVQGIRDSSVDELYSGELGQFESQIKRVVQSRGGKAKQSGARPSAQHFNQSENDLAALRSRTEGPIKTAAQKRIREQLLRRSSNFNEVNEESKYVQDEVRQQGDIVWDIIHSVDGRIFVCGSSKGMSEGVEQALRHIAKEKGGWNDEGAARFWQEQKEKGRFVVEAW